MSAPVRQWRDSHFGRGRHQRVVAAQPPRAATAYAEILTHASVCPHCTTGRECRAGTRLQRTARETRRGGA